MTELGIVTQVKLYPLSSVSGLSRYKFPYHGGQSAGRGGAAHRLGCSER